MNFFRTHLLAMLIIGLSQIAAVIIGVIVAMQDGWLQGLFRFLLIAAIGTGFGFVIAILNGMRLVRRSS